MQPLYDLQLTYIDPFLSKNSLYLQTIHHHCNNYYRIFAIHPLVQALIYRKIPNQPR